MKIYRIDYVDSHVGHCVMWAASKKEARKLISDVRNDDDTDAKKAAEHYGNPDWKIFRKCREFEYEKIDFPSTKDEILLWLTTWFDTDNG